MRNPNGYGTVAHLKGSRRNPYVARKTTGFDERGYPVYQVIGYYPTREAGLIALAKFNNDPWDVDKAKTTLEELYVLWLEKKAVKLGERSRNALRSAFKHCSALSKARYKSILAFQMQECIDECGRGYATQAAIKNLWGHLDKFALEVGIAVNFYSKILTAASIPETSKKPFSDAEIAALWAIAGEPWVDSVLMFLYTGFRISELLDVKAADVDLAAMTIKGGTKTEAGKNRLVPIHPRIEAMVRARLAEGGEYLFTYNGQRVSVWRYYKLWEVIMNRINAEHTVHETRHTFRSRLDSAGANKRCIDLLMGHKSNDVGERVYTHKTIEELRDAIQLLS